MIAEVYPIMRMPRKSRVFDYQIPENLGGLRRGDIVLVPFRSNRVWGVVARTKNIPERGIKLKSLLKKELSFSLSEKEVDFFEWLATDLAQSVSSVLYSSLPSFPKRLNQPLKSIDPHKPLTIPVDEQSSWQSLAEELHKRSCAFAYVSDIRRMTCVLEGYRRLNPKRKMIVVCPTVLDAERIFSHLQEEHAYLLTGDESDGQQFAVWKRYRDISSGIMVGTKNVLFSAGAKTDSIFFIRSHHENHGHHEQNPRFDARTVAQKISEHFKTNLFFLDVFPRVEDVFLFNAFGKIGNPLPNDVQIIDMSQQTRGGFEHAWISHEVFERLTETIDADARALCVLNKKYHAKRLHCVVCQKDVSCPSCQGGFMVDEVSMHCISCKTIQPRAHHCPTCHQDRLKEIGFGIQKIASMLKKMFPTTTICLVDKEHPSFDENAQIVLATSFFLEQIDDAFEPSGFREVVLLDADAMLYRTDYQASDSAVYFCEQWHALAKSHRAQLLIQTRSAEFFRLFYGSEKSFFQQELETRSVYKLPPSYQIITIEWKEMERRRAEVSIHEWSRRIQECSTSTIIQRSEPASGIWRLEVRFLPEDRDNLCRLFLTFPDHVIIDTQGILR